jgi:hypothetical protein
VLYAAALTLIGASIVGILPALRVTRGRLNDASAAGLRFGGLWTDVIVAQVAFTVALLPLAAGGVFESNRSSNRAAAIGAEHFLIADFAMDHQEYALDPAIVAARTRAIYEELQRRVAAEPGVEHVTFADRLPVEDQFKYSIEVDKAAGAPTDALRRSTGVNVGPGFFETFGTSVVAGRAFSPGDYDRGGVLLVNESFARHVFAGRNPIGNRIRVLEGNGSELPSEDWYEIVGIVRDFGWTLDAPQEQAAMYYPRLPNGETPISMAIRVSDPEAFAPRLRAIAADLGPLVTLHELQPLSQGRVGGADELGLDLGRLARRRDRAAAVRDGHSRADGVHRRQTHARDRDPRRPRRPPAHGDDGDLLPRLPADRPGRAGGKRHSRRGGARLGPRGRDPAGDDRRDVDRGAARVCRAAPACAAHPPHRSAARRGLDGSVDSRSPRRAGNSLKNAVTCPSPDRDRPTPLIWRLAPLPRRSRSPLQEAKRASRQGGPDAQHFHRRRSSIAACVLAPLLLQFAAPAPAAAAAPVSGIFTFTPGPALEIVDAVAYRRVKYGQEQVVVLLLPHKVDHTPLAGQLDVAGAVEAIADGVSHVELEYGEDGTWGGGSYRLRNQGGGMIYDPASEPAMRATIEGGAVRARLRTAIGTEAEVDLTLDVPIVVAVAGEALPADGGEPGASAHACNAAYRKKDRSGVDRFCSPHLGEIVDSAIRFQFETLWTPQGAGTCEVAAVTDLELRGGVVADDQARLEARGGSGEGETCAGPVFLRREKGAWRVSGSRMERVHKLD